MFGGKRARHTGRKPQRPAKWVPYSREREILDRVRFVAEIVTFVLIILTIIALINERDERRAGTDAKIRHLACFVVSFIPPNHTNPLIEGLRQQYHCPPFHPAAHSSPSRKHRAIGPETSFSNSTSPARRLPSSPAPRSTSRPIAGRQPLAPLSPSAPVEPSHTPRPRSSPTATVTITAPPSRTPGPTRSPTPTHRPRPSPTVVLPSLLCDQLQICITLPVLPSF